MEWLAGPGAKAGEGKSFAELMEETKAFASSRGVEELINWTDFEARMKDKKEIHDFVARSSQSTGSGDVAELSTARASAAPVEAPQPPKAAPESPGVGQLGPKTTQEPKPKDRHAILAAIKADKRSVMVMPLSYDDLEIVKRGYDHMPPFSKACLANDVRDFARLDYDVKERSWNGQTPLAIAVEQGWIDLAKRLIRKFDADVDAASNDGKTPLFWVTSLKPNAYLDETIDTLLKAGANIEHRSRLGQTPLSWAAANGHLQAIDSLFSNGADIEARSNSGQSPLSWAAMYGQYEAVGKLVGKGADIESTSNNSFTPLLWAMEKGHDSTTTLLLNLGAKLDNEKRLGTSSVFRALERGYHATLLALLNRHPEMIEERNQIMQTPLGWAAEQGDDQAVEFLLERGADIEAKSNNGQTPLSRAVTYAPWSTVDILLKNGANIESESYNGQTPLSWAAMYGRTDLIEKLLTQAGSNINTRSRNGQTPLDWAMEKGQDRVVELLEEAKLAAAASKA